MTCFLKRVLPFVLALVLGLMLGKFFAPGNYRSVRGVLVAEQPAAISEGELSLRRNMGGVSTDGPVFAPTEVDRKARIISRAEPQYTEQAKADDVTGTVVLRAVFTANGEVTNIRAVSGLPGGLTEKAVEAARTIKFSPAMKDGRFVSQYIQIEYNFSLY
jgi:TonB family protein